MSTISYGITVHNEARELHELLSLLLWNTPKDDEIIVVTDAERVTAAVLAVLHEFVIEIAEGAARISVYKGSLNNDFAQYKNFLNSKCTKDWIFQIDADELPSEELLANLHAILDMNDHVDIIAVPRINMVNNINKEDMMKWRWNRNTYGWINWPDYQMRLYKNIPSIKWVRPVHEILDGYTTYATLPAEREFALHHIKDIERQRKQNEFYETMIA